MATRTTTTAGYWAEAFSVLPTASDLAKIEHRVILPPGYTSAVCGTMSCIQSGSLYGELLGGGPRAFVSVAGQKICIGSMSYAETDGASTHKPKGLAG